MSAPPTSPAQVTTPVEYPSIRLFIDGEWGEGAGGRSDDIVNPATGKTLGRAAIRRGQRRGPGHRRSPRRLPPLA